MRFIDFSIMPAQHVVVDRAFQFCVRFQEGGYAMMNARVHSPPRYSHQLTHFFPALSLLPRLCGLQTSTLWPMRRGHRWRSSSRG